jgi:hypothetical protein
LGGNPARHFYAIIKWDKPSYIKIIALIGIIITWPIWSAVAFVTSASIIAGDKPYCVMVYNHEFHRRWNKLRNLAHQLYDDRILNAL